MISKKKILVMCLFGATAHAVASPENAVLTPEQIPATIALPFCSEEILRMTTNGRSIEIKANPMRFEAEPGKVTIVVERK